MEKISYGDWSRISKYFSTMPYMQGEYRIVHTSFLKNKKLVGFRMDE